MPTLRPLSAALLSSTLVLLAACGGNGTGDPTGDGPVAEEPAPAPDGDEEPGEGGAADLSGLDCGELTDDLVRADLTREGLRSAFGAPDTVLVSTEPYRHDPSATDSIFTVRYDGLELGLRKPPRGGALATHLRVSEPRFLRRPALIGATEEALVSALGEPDRRSGSERVWDCDGPTEEPVAFTLEDGRVRRVEVSFYVD